MGRMDRVSRTRLDIIIIRNLMAGILLVLLVILSTTGVTGAWFTDNTMILHNIFTTGTVIIEADDQTEISNGLTDSDTDLVTPGEPLEIIYKITNLGSKSIYVRVRFEGYWTRIYHRNTATVTASFGDTYLEDSDTTHYYFENQLPDLNTEEKTSAGFTDQYSLSSFLTIDKSSSNSTASATSENSGGGYVGTSQYNPLFAAAAMTGYPDPCEGPKVNPITEDQVKDEGLDYFDGVNPPDPNPANLPSPSGCTFNVFKINKDQGNIADGQVFTHNGFIVTIYKKLIGDKYYFAFESNWPAYHVYAKGGSQGGYLYRYYFPEDEPAYPGGVYSDCGLSQPGGDWSHITFYYFEVPDDPSINIKKQVSVDGGSSWEDADQSPGPELQSPHSPMFRFIVENTGNVTLTGIVVEDDKIDLAPGDPDTTSWVIPILEPGAADTLIIVYDQWTEQLSTENIKIELCQNMDNWVPEGLQDLGTYFYHTEVLKAENKGAYEVTLCVIVHFDDNENYQHGSEFMLYSYFEAVQASNNMIRENWPEEDLDWLND